jgi:hypothetical protein
MTEMLEITAGEVTLHARLYENETARQIYARLPILSSVNRWGEEIYFSIPLELELADDARVEMKIGELAYWPPGNAMCIFWGPTPASEGNEPRAASEVNPFGQVLGDASLLNGVDSGAEVRVRLWSGSE